MDDLPACLALAADRDWQPERRKWRLLLERGEGHGVDDPSGGLAGTVVLTRYGSGVAVVSMLLVASSHGRRGLGRRLMTHVLAQAGDATVFLYATELGRPLYERIGFRAAGAVTTCIGRFRGVAAGGSRPATDADVPAILALDAAVFGAPRDALLEPYLALSEQVRVVEHDGAIAGFAAVAANVDHVVVGPVLATDRAVAETLIADTAAHADDPVRLDIDHRHDWLLAWAEEHAIPALNPTALMVHGDRSLPGDRARMFTPIMQALG